MPASNSREDMGRVADELESMAKYHLYEAKRANALAVEVRRLNQHFTGAAVPVKASARETPAAPVPFAPPGSMAAWVIAKASGSYLDETTLVRASDIERQKRG